MTEQKIIKRKRKGKIKIKVGDKFGRWIVIEKMGVINGHTRFRCECKCGTIRIVPGYRLRNGGSKSCGCLSREWHTTHGMTETSEFTVWKDMIQRCTDPNSTGYENYGGRGITICPEWLHSFETFFKDLGERPKGLTIERINNDLGYFKENCCWKSRTAQARNRRIRKTNKTGVCGVHWHKPCKKYCVRIGVGSKRIHIGVFKNIEDAKVARIAAEQKYWK